MSAPGLWIAVPLAMGIFCLMLLTERAAAWTAGLTCSLLSILALLVPIDTALLIGPISFKIGSTASLLGRNLVIRPSEGPLIACLFALCAIWLFGAEAAGVARRLVPMGLSMTSLLVASIAVQPFLYAALLIELAVLVAIPLLAPLGETPGRSVFKFLTYQTLGMPCILLAGWSLTGVEASPGDLALTVQATVMLSLGFAFLLAIFPLHDWIPGLAAESHPYPTGFLLWLLPSVVILFGLNFLDGYSWLRSSPQVINGLRILGLLMIVTAGAWSALENNLGRLFGQAVIAENGLALVATSLSLSNGGDLVFPLFIPRGLTMAAWALGLAILHRAYARLDLPILKTAARTHPWAGGAIALAALSTAGFPLLAGFPARIDVWNGIAAVSGADAVWYMIGLVGLMIGGLRQLGMLVSAQREPADLPQESLPQRIMLGAAATVLILLGVFPRAMDFIVMRLPLMFEHLAR